MDVWENRYGGLQMWVEREQALPQFGGTLPAEEMFALWIEAARRHFPESDDFRRRLEIFLADTQRQLARDEAGKSMSVTVLGHGTDNANGGDASNVAGAVAGAIAASPVLSGPSRAFEGGAEASEVGDAAGPAAKACAPSVALRAPPVPADVGSVVVATAKTVGGRTPKGKRGAYL